MKDILTIICILVPVCLMIIAFLYTAKAFSDSTRQVTHRVIEVEQRLEKLMELFEQTKNEE